MDSVSSNVTKLYFIRWNCLVKTHYLLIFNFIFWLVLYASGSMDNKGTLRRWVAYLMPRIHILSMSKAYVWDYSVRTIMDLACSASEKMPARIHKRIALDLPKKARQLKPENATECKFIYGNSLKFQHPHICASYFPLIKFLWIAFFEKIVEKVHWEMGTVNNWNILNCWLVLAGNSGNC